MGTPLALTLLVGMTVAGRALDAVRGGTTALALAFLAACLLAALLVRRDGLAATSVAPPLVLAAVVGVAELAGGAGSLQGRALSAATDVVVLFPVLATGTAAAVVVALVRVLARPSAPAHHRG